MAKSLRSLRLWLSPGRLTGLVTLAVFAPVLATAFRVPLLVLEPGPAPDVAEKSRIRTSTFASAGSFHLTTVQIRRPDGSTLLEILRALLDEDKVLVTRASVYPPGGSIEQTDRVQAAQMVQSEVAAAAAAFKALGIEYQLDGALVVDVQSDSPAAEVLRPGDVITGLDSHPIAAVDDLAEVMTGRRAGDTVMVTFRRDDRTDTRSVETVAGDADPGRTVIGVQVSQYHRAPIEIDFDAADIGGPSAGLMYALSIYDRLEESDLTGGRVIAGTGTLDEIDGRSGVVGGVGAVDLKVKGALRIDADVFVVPEGAEDEARSVAGSAMEVIGVSSFEEAIAELKRGSPSPARAFFQKIA